MATAHRDVDGHKFRQVHDEFAKVVKEFALQGFDKEISDRSHLIWKGRSDLR
jgi:hypothetical protein